VQHAGTETFLGIATLAAQPSGAVVGVVDDAPEGSAVMLGRRVLVPAFDPCGQCDVCRRGGAAVCPLGKRRELGKRIRANARWVVALGDGLELPVPAAAAVAGDVALAYTMYARTGLGPREPAVITGATPVTRFLVEILRAKDITPTVVAEPGEFADWLLAKGCAVVSARPEDVHAAISAQGMGNRPLRLLATGAPELAASLAGPRATLTVLAPCPALPGDLVAKEVTVIGVAGPHPDLIVEAAAMCVKGEIDPAGGVGEGATRARVEAY
jgi:threonine dehydrogenase-like Zn-dependent dehydrogenase